jgi:hypothetical protein
MQRHGFEMHDVFCSAPGNLGEELQSFHVIVGEVNEAVGMAHKTLLAPLCLKSNNLILIAADAAKDNIRYCSFFVQVLQDSWGPVGLFRELYDVAAECLADEQAPMRSIAVFVKPPASVEIPSGAPVYHYDQIQSFEAQLRTVCTEWLSAVVGVHSI